MDGTMFDTERLRFKMLKQASKEIYGTEISDEILFNSLGISAINAEKLAKESYGNDYPYKKIRELGDQLERRCIKENGVPVKAGLYNLLERLKRNGVLIALATSSRREVAEEYLANAKVLKFFDIMVYGDEVEKGKPDPEIFLKAARDLNCDPNNCFIFEDSQNGLLAASAAGGVPIFIKDIKEPDLEIRKLAFRYYNKMTDFLDELIAQMPKMPMPTLNEHFPQSMGYHIVGIHGFGAIGGGYIAQIFSYWDGYTKPREIIGATNNNLIRQLVNGLGKYAVKYESLAYFQTIKNVKIIDMSDEGQIIKMYRKSDIIGLALPEQAIKVQAKVIAKGLLDRYDNGGKALTLLIVMNKINSAKFVKTHVENALKQLIDEKRSKKIVENTFFTETVVNRFVSKISSSVVLSNLQKELHIAHENIIKYSEESEQLLNFSRKYFAEKKSHTKKNLYDENQAIYEAINFANKISSVTQFANKFSKLNITLFTSEPDMPIYASKGSPLLERLRQVVTVDSIKSMQEIKNKLSNGPHAIIAWYSTLLGYKTIGQGMGDPRISKLVENIIKNEIRPALLLENPKYVHYINSITSNFLKRCRASFKDKCSRVGRDPIRKLQRGERIMGAIQIALKHGLCTKGLEFGAACAIMYSISNRRDGDLEALKIKELYQKNNSVIDALTYRSVSSKSYCIGLDINDDHDLIMRIQENFKNLEKELSPDE